jgi:hypothetical protein
MTKLHNFALGRWMPHEGEGEPQHNAITGELIATCGSAGLDYGAMMEYSRNVGGPGLRRLTFRERGLMLKHLALYLHNIRKKHYPLSYQTGATKTDSWIDIDGGIGTLFAYASLRREFPDQRFYVDGEAVNLSKEGSFIGHHIMTPKEGVAVHINAFNFPVWGMLEKLSVKPPGGSAGNRQTLRTDQFPHAGDRSRYHRIGYSSRRRAATRLRPGHRHPRTCYGAGRGNLHRLGLDRPDAQGPSAYYRTFRAF